MRLVKGVPKRRLVAASLAAVLALVAMTMPLGGAVGAQGPEFDWDQEFPYTVYLVHITETGTVNGPVEKDVYILFPKPPEDGVLLTADGYGGWFVNKAESASGGLTTPRQVCAAVAGIPPEKRALFGQVPQLPDFSCSQLDPANAGPEDGGRQTTESSAGGEEPGAGAADAEGLVPTHAGEVSDEEEDFERFLEELFGGRATVDDLVRDLERFLAGKRVNGPTAGQAATAGAVSAALLAAWVRSQIAAGRSAEDLVRAVSRWGRKQKGAVPQTGAVPSQKTASRAGDTSKSKPSSVPTKDKSQGGTGLNAPAKAPHGTRSPETSRQPTTQDAVEWKKRMLETYFDKAVGEALARGFMVDNRNVVEKAFLRFPVSGRAAHRLGGVTGGQCGEFAEWGREWIKPYAEQIFGEGVIVDTIRLEERSSGRAQMLLHDPIEWVDSWVRANHAATRVILPNGETYVLDFWQAVGDRQRSHYDGVVDRTYEEVFNGPPRTPEVKIMKESQWIKKWSDRIGEAGDPAVVHNLNEDQEMLKTMIHTLGDEDKAISVFRKTMKNKMPAQKLETIINSYREGGVWWGRKF